MRNSVFYRPFGPNTSFKQLTNASYPIIHAETSSLTRYFRLSNTYIIHILAFIQCQLFTPYSYYSPLSFLSYEPRSHSNLFKLLCLCARIPVLPMLKRLNPFQSNKFLSYRSSKFRTFLNVSKLPSLDSFSQNAFSPKSSS